MAALAVAIGSIAVAAAASSAPRLPAVGPDQLVASVLRALASDPTIEGHVSAHVDLGLPDVVSGTLTQQGGPIPSLLGDHRLRVWRSPDGLRLTEQLAMGERSVYVNRVDSSAWLWDWNSFTAYRAGPLPPPQDGSGEDNAPPLPDPLSMARMALRAIDPTTAVSVASTERVAGRAAYTLVLEPRTSATLVGRVEIAIDAGRRLPLRVAVFARGSDVARISAGFTTVGFGPIDPSTFRFHPPTSAKVEPLRDLLRQGVGTAGLADLGEYAGGPVDVRTFGAGWASIAAVRLPKDLLDAAATSGDAGLLSLLPFSGNLFSIRLVQRGDHGWVVYGAVPQSALAGVEGRLP